MNSVLSEKDYQKYILEKLKGIGYKVCPAKGHYDRLFAVSRPELFAFLEATQPDAMAALRKVYKAETEDTIVSAINTEETKARGSRLDVLKHGLDISNIHLNLLYTKPAASFNKELVSLYEKNVFSVSEEVWASDEERIDLVIFLNGLAVIAFELKANTAGQNYHDAILQYRTKRNPKTRLFRFKAGTLVNFAMDLEECYMTTRLDGEATFFLPFNMGRGTGIDTGAGNPVLKDEYSVHYMWDNILQKDSLTEIITKFMFIEVSEKEDAKTGKKKTSETVIFTCCSTRPAPARPMRLHGCHIVWLPSMMPTIRLSLTTSSSVPTAGSWTGSYRKRSCRWNTSRGSSASWTRTAHLWTWDIHL